jgi:thiosulfate reductase cytochrome b subunit
MADAASLPALAIPESDRRSPRHSALVRLTHWTTAVCFVGLVVSGFEILLAHPRLYWGETGALGGPSLFDLPLPLVLTGQTGWARSLHFLSAWILIPTGLLYAGSGIVTRHFRNDLMPFRSDLSWRVVRRVVSDHVHLGRTTGMNVDAYNVLQRLTYVAVVFALFPLMIWTGFAMSPAITSVFPWLVTLLDGQQSARSIHFFDACLLVLFLLVHVTMVGRWGFVERMRAMVTGGRSVGGRA